MKTWGDNEINFYKYLDFKLILTKRNDDLCKNSILKQ